MILAMYEEGSEPLRPRARESLCALGSVDRDITEDEVMAIGLPAEQAPEAFNESDMYTEVIMWILHVMTDTEEDRYLVRAAATRTASALTPNCSDQTVVEQLATHAIEGLYSDGAPLRQATFRVFARMADVLGGSAVAVFGPHILVFQSISILYCSRYHPNDFSPSPTFRNDNSLLLHFIGGNGTRYLRPRFCTKDERYDGNIPEKVSL